MKHLIKDEELMAYIEGRMEPQQAKTLISKIKGNGEMDLLYHLEHAWAASLTDFADSMLGPDDEYGDERGLLAAKDKKN